MTLSGTDTTHTVMSLSELFVFYRELEGAHASTGLCVDVSSGVMI